MTATIEEPRPYVDPGHVLPDEDWAKVVKRAREIREEVQEDAGGGASGPGGIILDMTAMGIASKKYFPVSGIPTQLLVLHSAECPLRGGYAKSLSEWACSTVYPAPPIASWQRFIDPLHRVRLIPDELGAWHASEANVMSIGWEQAGYARYSRAEWLTPDGLTQLEMLALDMAEVAVRDGIPPRWLTTAEVTAATNGNRSIKGFCSHRQIDPETRTDPGDGYPYELLMERIIFYMGGGSPALTIPTDEDDKMLVIATEPAENGRIWIGDGITRRHIPTPGILDAYKKMSEWGILKIFKDGDVQTLPMDALGVDVTYAVNRFTQASINERAAGIVAEVRSQGAHNADRILDALAAAPSVDIPEDLLASLREEFAKGAATTAASIKDTLDDINVTLKVSTQEPVAPSGVTP